MINNIKIYPAFNSRGKETVEVKVFTGNSAYTASIPAGTSKGSNEAKDLPVSDIMGIFPKIRHYFIGMDEKNWREADKLLQKIDKTKDFSNIGVNLALAISIAIARAATDNQLYKLGKRKFRTTFPLPVSNVFGGGKHGGNCDWQEFLIIPHKATDPYMAFKTVLEVWGSIGEELLRKKILVGKNIEEAWMSRLTDLKTLDFLSDIASDWDVKIGIDFAASSIWTGKNYRYKKLRKTLSPEKHFNLVLEIAKKYNIYYLEDPFHENDFKAFRNLTEELGGKALVIGDDLYCTNQKRFERGIKHKSTNGIIIKPNQIGTLTQTEDVVRTAEKNNIRIIPSHRSKETFDPWLSDLAVAWHAPLIKIGMGADIAKHNRLIQLWKDIPNVRMAELSF